MSNSDRVMQEYQRQMDEFQARIGGVFPFGGRESRKIIGEIVKSGKVNTSEGSLQAGLQGIDRAAEIARRH